jgi:hypothetical protein
MLSRIARYSCRKGLALLGAGFLLTFAVSGQPREPQAADGLIYKFVNNTDGKFTDDQCFWSLNDGREWHSFAKEPSVRCPGGNGRVYFRLGAAPRNFDDREAYWDFIEYAYSQGTWHGNTTQVDAFCIPITIELGSKKVGIAESRRKLFEAFRKDSPKEFQTCVNGDRWILSPCRAGFGKGGPNGKYFDKYIDAVWDTYSEEKKTPSGKWIGKVIQGALTFSPVDGGKAISCAKKPSTQDAFLGTGTLTTNPQFCAAINRHVLADPADWNNPAAFYQAEPCNWYSKFLHEHSIDHKAYGFCYDDAADQAAYFSGQGHALIVTLSWDTEPAAKPDKR